LIRVNRSGLVVACLLLTSCAAPGDEETDRQATVLADAIGYPRQSSAAGLARAALATPLGKSPSFSLIEATDLPGGTPSEPMAHLVFRIHREGGQTGWKKIEPLTACYGASFDYYGVIGAPERISCPVDAVAITPPPVPRREIPVGYDSVLKSTLAALPLSLSSADVLTALGRDLPAPPVDPSTGLVGVVPAVEAAVTGVDVAVAVHIKDGDEIDCLFGTRVGGVVEAWSPSRKQVRPGELSCSPATAFSLQSPR
jgi:hypothetical protein